MGLLVLFSVSRHQVKGIRYQCGHGHGMNFSNEDTDGYRMTVSHERLNPNIDLIPNITYTVEIGQQGLDRQIQALELEILYDGFGNGNESHAHDMDCGNLLTPIRVKWTPDNNLNSCVTLRAIICENPTKCSSISLEICKPKGCRQYYNADKKGMVLSPGFPVRYTDSYNCTYVIYSLNQHQVRLQFRSFDLEPAYDSECFDSVVIETRNITSTICGTRNSTGLNDMNFYSDDGILYLIFTTDYKVVARGFDAYFYSLDKAIIDGCNYVTSNLTGHIHSPNYPDKYFPMMKCEVKIMLPSRFRISLHLQHLDLDKSSKLGKCSGDEDNIKIIKEGMDDEFNNLQFCGSKMDYSSDQTVIQSSGSIVSVIFQSYSLHESKGFMMQYSAVESCKNVTYNSATGIFSSVNFPDNYLNNQNCFMIINQTESSRILEVKFQYFYTVSYENDACLNTGSCNDDYVEIDNGDVVMRMCGQCTRDGVPLIIHSTSGFISLRFVTNSHQTRSGYSGRWRLVDTLPNVELTCPNKLIDTKELIYEVIWMKKPWSQANIDCGKRGGILASVSNISIQRLLEKLLKDNVNCSQEMPSFWIGASDRIFEGDYYWADLSRLNFTYWFEGWPDYGFDINQPSDDGLSDEDCVEIRNSFPLPVKGTRATSSYYWNDRNCLVKNSYICQRSKQEVTKPATWNQLITSRVIDVDMDSQEKVIINSPHFPGNYTDFTDIIHHISSSNPFHRLHVHFEAFDLETSDRCIYDNLTLSSFSNTFPDIVRCGDWNPKIKLIDWTSKSNLADLQFRTDNSVSASGFKLSVIAREDPGCREAFNDKYHKMVGDPKIMLISHDHLCYLILPRATESYQNAGRTCAGYNASLFYQTTQDQCSMLTKAIRSIYSDYSQDYISIWTGGETKKNVSVCEMRNIRLSGLECFEVDDVLNSVDCHIPRPFVCVKEHHAKDDDKDTNHIQKVVLRTPGGQIKWPPKSTGHLYGNNLHKEYEIHATDGHRVFITVEYLEIEYQQECLYDYLSLTEIVSNSAVLCGNTSTIHKSYFLSTKQQINILFHTDSSIGDKGFEISWKWIDSREGIQIIPVNNESYSGSSSSINYPLPYPDVVRYCKSLKLPSQFRIILTFKFINVLENNKSDPAFVFYTQDQELVLPYKLNATFPASQRTFISERNHLRLCLHVDSIEENGGFSATYTRSSDKTLRISESMKITPKLQNFEAIQSIHFPNDAPSNHEHIIYLTTDIGYNIVLEFTNISLVDSLRSSAYLEVTDTSLGNGYDKNIINMTIDSTFQRLPVVRSHLNSVQVIFVTGYGTEKHCLFQAKYSSLRDDDYLEKTKHITNGSLNYCDNVTCINGGGCVQLKNSRYTCECGANRTGLFCQTFLCDLFPCVQGRCSVRNGGPTCECESDIWGKCCNMTFVQCNEYQCQGHGVCAESQNDPMCICSGQWTGDDCSVKIPEQKETIAAGEKLLNEPIWIGMIVVLNLVFAFTSMFIVRRRCEKKFKCCKETKSSEDNKAGRGVHTENNYPCLGDMYKHYRYKDDKDASLDDKEGEEDSKEIESPDINFSNHRAAAKLFASYNNRQPDLTVPVLEKHPNMLEKNSEDCVGGMKGGTINFCPNYDMDMHCDDISENEIAEACLDAAVPILKISEIGMSSLEKDYLCTFENRSWKIGSKDSPQTNQHCYPKIVVVDSTPPHFLDSPVLRRSGLEMSCQPPMEKHTPFRLLDAESKRQRFASKLWVEKPLFNTDSLSGHHSPKSTLYSSSELPDVRSDVSISESHGFAPLDCSQLSKIARDQQVRSRCMASREERYDTGTSEYASNHMSTEKQRKNNPKEEGLNDSKGGTPGRKMRAGRMKRRKKGHSIEIGAVKYHTSPKTKTSSDSNLEHRSKSKHRWTRKKQKQEQCQSIQRMLESSLIDDTGPNTASKMSVRKSRSNDLVPSQMVKSSCTGQNSGDANDLYRPMVQRRHSYHTQQNSNSVYDPDSMLNKDQMLAYRMELSESDLSSMPPYLSYKILEESATSSDISGTVSSNNNKTGPLKVPSMSDTDTGFSSSTRSLRSPNSGKDDADLFLHSLHSVKVNKTDSAYQTKQKSANIKSDRNKEIRTPRTRKDSNVVVRLQMAAKRLQNFSSSGDSALNTTISEDESDNTHRKNRILESPKKWLEGVSEEYTSHTFDSDSLGKDRSMQDSVIDIELKDFTCA
ncbi:uncharacterized protein LOC132560445 [Ylistrum balloti]|uniref:uncharacterized protein LOC132560445 n=1 Tax=Ylistrum balloti TaxID=509963 RepID=UPI002905D217|nr:uncharacterized protein LOC132560445 [Ylistrum balloti]